MPTPTTSPVKLGFFRSCSADDKGRLKGGALLEIYLAQQTIAFLWSLALGAVLGLVYDVFRVTRIALPTPRVVVAVEDILFFAVCAISTFLFLLGSADGKVRVFLLLGELLGAVLYFCTLSLVVMGFSRAIIAFVYGVISFLIRFLLLPLWRLLYAIVSIMLKPVLFLCKILQKVAARSKYGLKKGRVVVYNLIMAYLPRKKETQDEKGSEHEA